MKAPLVQDDAPRGYRAQQKHKKTQRAERREAAKK